MVHSKRYEKVKITALCESENAVTRKEYAKSLHTKSANPRTLFNT